MKKGLCIFAALLVPAVACEPAFGRQASCPGFAKGGSSPLQVERFYAELAVAIVQAGLADDKTKLGKLVSPNAKFSTGRGDYSTGGRQSGVSGAIEWSRDLTPSKFESFIERPGPITMTTIKCEMATTILFRTRDATTGVKAVFKFVDGRLIEASGQEVIILDGDVR